MPTLNTVIKQASRGADLYFVFRFLRLLTMKYEKTAAYKLGIIDKKGKPLKRSSELESVDEKAAYTMLHRLVFKIRRLIEKVPIIGKSILLNYAAALFLLKEQNNTRVWTDENYAMRKLNEFIDNEDWVEDAKNLREEVKQMDRLKFKEYLTEDGHTDVASIKNQVKIAMSALQKMNTELSKLPDDGALPTWWTNKVAIAVDKLDGMADYLDTKVEGVIDSLIDNLNEREMTDAEMDKREKIIMSLKKKKDEFEKRYGDKAKEVMYATATKMAMKKEAKRGPCWQGYVQQGMKKKGDRLVPNCVPEQVGVRKVDFVDGVTDKVELEEAPFMTKGNKRVVDAFYDKKTIKAHGGSMLTTDGETLTKRGMGGQDIAKWVNGKIKIVAKIDVKSTEQIVNYMKKSIPSGVFEEMGNVAPTAPDSGGIQYQAPVLGQKKKKKKLEVEKEKKVLKRKYLMGGNKIQEDSKMGRQSDDQLRKLYKTASAKDQSSPANKSFTKRIEKEMKKRGIQEEIQRSTFAGKDVFIVDADTYYTCRLGKRKYARYEKYVGSGLLGQAIREYGLKYPKRPIILQNGEGGPMLYLKYGRS